MKTSLCCLVVFLASTLANPVIDSGVVGDRIVGGEATTIQKYPHQLSLRRRLQHYCGGFILSPTRGVSSGRCVWHVHEEVPITEVSIMAGSTLRTGDSGAQFRPLTRVLIHPLHEKPQYANDISILFWELPLNLGPTVRPVKLPQRNAPVPYGQNATVTGFGPTRLDRPISEVLMRIHQPIVSHAECKKQYKVESDNVLCAGTQLPLGTCHGDEGGALLFKGVVLGVLAWDNSCITLRDTSLYTLVPPFVDWLQENMK